MHGAAFGTAPLSEVAKVDNETDDLLGEGGQSRVYNCKALFPSPRSSSFCLKKTAADVDNARSTN